MWGAALWGAACGLLRTVGCCVWGAAAGAACGVLRAVGCCGLWGALWGAAAAED